jgi:hypothetical protein
MLVDSLWFRTNATSAELGEALSSVGSAEGPLDVSTGSQYRIGFPFSDTHVSEWENAQSTGAWYCTLVELRRVSSPDQRADRIVGVVGPRVAWPDPGWLIQVE